MNTPGRAELTIRKRLAKWREDAFNAARVPESEFRRGPHAYVVVILTLWLLITGGVCLIGAAAILEMTGALEKIPGSVNVVRPTVLVWSLVKTFFVYLLFLHLFASFWLVKYHKAALQAMEYAYLFLGAFGLVGVASVGIDQAGWWRRLYADEVANMRSNFDFYAENVARPLCGQLGPRLPSIPTAAVCQWIDEAKTLVHRPLDANSTADREEVRKLIEDGKKLDATIPLAARARAVVEGGDKGATIPEDLQRDLTENQRAGFRWFRSVVERVEQRIFEDLLKRGGQIAKIDAEIKETENSLSVTRWFGFFLLAFAIALRITKASVETFKIGQM